jgi:hypothetical protein
LLQLWQRPLQVKTRCLLRIMADAHQGAARIPRGLHENVHEVVAQGGVKRRGGFVCQDQFGLTDEGTGGRHALLLAQRQGVGTSSPQAFWQTHALQPSLGRNLGAARGLAAFTLK